MLGFALDRDMVRLIGVLTLIGVDKTLEAMLVDRMPPWLVDLTTRF